MGDGISLRQAVLGGAAVVLALAVGGAAYWRSLADDVVEPARLAVAEVAPDAEALAAVERAIAAGRTTSAEVVLDEAAANRAIFAEWLADPARDARFVLDPPFARLSLSQREGEGRYLNAELVVTPYADERGLRLKVNAGRVGAVSISATRGEWVRERIERQIAADLARNPRTAALFAGLSSARVTAKGLVLKF